MARIKYFKDSHIAVYIYAEKYGKHHEKHILVVNGDEDCVYGFDGKPLSCSKALTNRNDRRQIREWIFEHRRDLEEAWDDINNGKKPKCID